MADGLAIYVTLLPLLYFEGVIARMEAETADDTYSSALVTSESVRNEPEIRTDWSTDGNAAGIGGGMVNEAP